VLCKDKRFNGKVKPHFGAVRSVLRLINPYLSAGSLDRIGEMVLKMRQRGEAVNIA
jgi:hypothetical protein